mgnify:CR=1 FL=1
MQTILVPTDFSKNANSAFKYALEFAKSLKAKIILLHAFESPVIYSDIPLTTVQFDYAMLHDAAVKKMNNYFRQIQDSLEGVKVELTVQQGLASARIIETAHERKADLIVMGATGASAMERVLVGSNANRVIKNAPCMVMAIPPKAKFDGINKIVFTTDLSDENLEHAQSLIPFAKKFGAEILFLTVENIFNDEEIEIEAMNKKIKKFVKYPRMSGFLCADLSVTEGITYFLKEHNVDILAMYTHHRNVFQQLFNKSITKKIALHTTVPLLVIHKND